MFQLRANKLAKAQAAANKGSQRCSNCGHTSHQKANSSGKHSTAPRLTRVFQQPMEEQEGEHAERVCFDSTYSARTVHATVQWTRSKCCLCLYNTPSVKRQKSDKISEACFFLVLKPRGHFLWYSSVSSPYIHVACTVCTCLCSTVTHTCAEVRLDIYTGL